MNTTLNILIGVLIIALFFIIYCMCVSQDKHENKGRFSEVIYVNQKEIIYQDKKSQEIEMDDGRNFGIRNPSTKK